MATLLSAQALGRIARGVKRRKEQAAKDAAEQQALAAADVEAKRLLEQIKNVTNYVERAILAHAHAGDTTFTFSFGEQKPVAALVQHLLTHFAEFNPVLSTQQAHAIVTYDTDTTREYTEHIMTFSW